MTSHPPPGAVVRGPLGLREIQGPSTPGSRASLRKLNLVRWGAIVGQTAAILVVHFGLGFEVPLGPAIAVVAIAVLLNIGCELLLSRGAWLTERQTAFVLGVDLVQVSLLLSLTGGLENPFVLLLLAPVTVSASVLTLRTTILLVLLTLVSISGLLLWHLPLPWPTERIEPDTLYMIGLWLGLSLAVIFVGGYVASITTDARHKDEALAATQLALEREQRFSALGGLAAAVAHDLGTPLGTIAIVAKELARELPPDSPWSEDAELLLAETARCKEILATLSQRQGDEEVTAFRRIPLSALLEQAADPFLGDEVRFEIRLVGEGPQPVVMRAPELLHAFGALIQNAMQFAHEETGVEAGWDEEKIEVRITDDGAGIDPALIERLGEPYLSTRGRDPRVGGEGSGEHMGLGIFIARSLIERFGGSIRFENVPYSGARVTVTLPRRSLDSGAWAAADRLRDAA